MIIYELCSIICEFFLFFSYRLTDWLMELWLLGNNSRSDWLATGGQTIFSSEVLAVTYFPLSDLWLETEDSINSMSCVDKGFLKTTYIGCKSHVRLTFNRRKSGYRVKKINTTTGIIVFPHQKHRRRKSLSTKAHNSFKKVQSKG